MKPQRLQIDLHRNIKPIFANNFNFKIPFQGRGV